MGWMIHPKTGESIKDYVFYELCENNDWNKHDYFVVSRGWAEIIEQCARCGHERNI